jgi:DNA-binding NarL/FixJ family response regulator
MRVLIADDKVWLRSALRLLLEYEGNFEVVGEAGEASMLPALISHNQPDLLFLDWQLPGLSTNMERRRLTDRLHGSDPKLYIIALTDDSHAQSCLRFGADDFVNRSESPDRIMTTVRHAAAKMAGANRSSANGRPLH